MLSLRTLVFDREPLLYDGAQLAPHFLFRKFDLMGDALVAFAGPAQVSLDHMVDLEDVKKKAPIASDRMLHFIGEWFIDSLDQGILLQHLFVGGIYESLLERGIPKLHRRGNDIYFDNRKLSVSIATKSPVSVLMHSAVNIESTGAPIPISALNEMNVEPWSFAREALERFSRDCQIWRNARVKVMPR